MASDALIRSPADQAPFGIARPPGSSGYTADSDPRIPNKVAFDVERESVGGSVSDVLIRGGSAGVSSGNACSNDQFVGRGMLDI
jgi:hypothetical protein